MLSQHHHHHRRLASKQTNVYEEFYTDSGCSSDVYKTFSRPILFISTPGLSMQHQMFHRINVTH